MAAIWMSVSLGFLPALAFGTLRNGAKEVVEYLRSKGIEVVMLSVVTWPATNVKPDIRSISRETYSRISRTTLLFILLHIDAKMVLKDLAIRPPLPITLPRSAPRKQGQAGNMGCKDCAKALKP